MYMRKTAALLLGVLISVATLVSCSSSGSPRSIKKVDFPLANKIDLSLYTVEDVTGNPFFARREKATNIHINFICPQSIKTMASEYNLIVQSGDLPDMIQHQWFGYDGGLDKAIDDGVYIDLTPYIDGGVMPNFKALLDANPAARKAITTPKGRIAFINTIYPKNMDVNKLRNNYVGPVIRQDFLDKLQLKSPVTIADWHTVLTAFKTQLNIKYPLTLNEDGIDNSSKAFIMAYGVNNGLYIDDKGKVQFGLVQEAARQYVTEMNKWVKEGLLFKIGEPVSGNSVGATTDGFYQLSYYKKAASDPNYRLVGAKYPVIDAGKPVQRKAIMPPAKGFDNNGISITTANKHPVETCQWLDYLFSKEGVIDVSYGVLNDTYIIDKNGEYQFTDKVKNYSKGFPKTMVDIFWKYSPTWDGLSEIKGYNADEQDAIVNQWSGCYQVMEYPARSTVTNYMTEAEQATINSADITGYLSGEVAKMIWGELPLSHWDEMIQQAKGMGLADQLTVYQKAYDKYIQALK